MTVCISFNYDANRDMGNSLQGQYKIWFMLTATLGALYISSCMTMFN